MHVPGESGAQGAADPIRQELAAGCHREARSRRPRAATLRPGRLERVRHVAPLRRVAAIHSQAWRLPPVGSAFCSGHRCSSVASRRRQTSLIESAMTPRANSLAASLAIVIAGAPATARANDIVLKDAASMSGAVTWLSSGAPGLVLAVVRGGESVVLGFRETRPGSKGEPDGRSILRMGPLAQVMTGHLLARQGAKPHATLLAERVARRLGMLGTTTKLRPAEMPRAMTGRDLDGKEAPLWEAPTAMDASGNVFTTGDDMVRWMRWQLAVNDAAGAEVRMIDQAPYRWHDGLKAAVGVGGEKMDGLGLGWIISMAREKRPLILTKSGGIAGFMTYVVLAPTRGVGVFVAVNRLNFPMFEGLTSAVHDLVADLAPR